MRLYMDIYTKVVGLVVKNRNGYYAMYTIVNRKLRKIRFKKAYINKWLIVYL